MFFAISQNSQENIDCQSLCLNKVTGLRPPTTTTATTTATTTTITTTTTTTRNSNINNNNNKFDHTEVILYKRYVDDIFFIFNCQSDAENAKT